MFYLIWFCATCSPSAPINLGLYDNLASCENAKEMVVRIPDKDWARKHMSCVPKGVSK